MGLPLGRQPWDQVSSVCTREAGSAWTGRNWRLDRSELVIGLPSVLTPFLPRSDGHAQAAGEARIVETRFVLFLDRRYPGARAPACGLGVARAWNSSHRAVAGRCDL